MMNLEPVRINLFGSFSVVSGDLTIEKFPTLRSKLLLGYLAYHRQLHSRGLLAEMLWPGANPDVIRFRLNQTVAEIRRTVQPFGDLLHSDRFSIQLDPRVKTDVADFLSLASRGQWREALRLGSQPFMPGVLDDWVTEATDYLVVVNQGILEKLADQAVASNRWEDAESAARLALVADPYSEQFMLVLLRSLIAMGKRVDALRTFEDFEELLNRDFAMDPSEEIRALVGNLERSSGAKVTGFIHDRSVLRSVAQRNIPSTHGDTVEAVFEAFLLANDAERAMEFASSMIPYWNLRGELHVGRRWFKQIFSMPQAMSAGLDTRCIALLGFSNCAISMHDFKIAEVAISHASDIALRLEDRQLKLEVGRAKAQFALRQCHWDEALPHFLTCKALAEERDDRGSIADALTGIGEVYRFKGQLQDAYTAHRKALEIRINMGRDDRAAHSNLNLGIVVSRLGKFHDAILKIQLALDILRTQGSRAVVADCLMELGGALAFIDCPIVATQFLAAVSKLRESISAPIPASDRPDYVRFLSQSRSKLDRAAFSREWEFGRSTSLDTLIQSALSIEAQSLL